MNTKNINHQPTLNRKQTIRNVLIFFGVIAILLILLDLSPFGGSIHFYSKWIECGQKPVAITGHPGSGRNWYKVPYDYELTRLGYTTYYCSPADAEAAGYGPYNWVW